MKRASCGLVAQVESKNKSNIYRDDSHLSAHFTYVIPMSAVADLKVKLEVLLGP